MADLSQVRTRMISVIALLAVIDAAALIYLALPYRAGATQPATVQRQAEEEYRRLKPTTVPLQGIDQKLSRAQKDDAAFIHNRLPSRYSDVVEELGKLAKTSHIGIGSIAYNETPAPLAGIYSLEMHAGLSGQYVDLIKFINSVERDKMFFIVDGINLAGQQGGQVRLDVRLDTYLRDQE